MAQKRPPAEAWAALKQSLVTGEAIPDHLAPLRFEKPRYCWSRGGYLVKGTDGRERFFRERSEAYELYEKWPRAEETEQ